RRYRLQYRSVSASVTRSSSFYSLFSLSFDGVATRLNRIYPVTPETSEATSMENFASAISKLSEKDSKATNKDIVKPIPAKRPTPIICVQDAPCGMEPMRKRIASLVIR